MFINSEGPHNILASFEVGGINPKVRSKLTVIFTSD